MRSWRCLTGCLLAVLCSLLASHRPTAALTVHLVPHTHDDVGWLKTFEQYYVGLNNSLQQAGVQYILDSTVAALIANPNRKFIYGEQAFFSRWWRYQTEETKQAVRQLVAERRLEFVNGGWCMHDEATTHYIDMIDQTTLGHLFILAEFGELANPRVGWQIDPFGHSATHASLLTAALGLDATFFSKYDYQDHSIRRDTKQLELVWRPSPSLGTAGQVWTGTFPNLGDYGPPPGLCFDYFCQDTDNDPVQADRRLEDYNLDKKVQRLLDYAHWQASVTKGDEETMNIMFYLGSDFQYEAANEWFESLDILIDAVNSLPNSTVRAMYSTPSLYTYARNAEGLTWQVKKDDFFPYGISANAYRTGFYTSRPALKRYVRELSHRLQVARQLEVFSGGDGAATRALWEAMGVVQHHDAVSGTERQHVAYNYAYLLAKGAVSSDQLIAQSLAKLSTLKGSPLPFAQCPQANVSLCQTTQTGEPTAILVYNSQSRNQSFVVRFPVNASSGSVYDANGQLATNFALYPLQPTEATAVGGAEYEVLVEVEVPAMGWSTLFWQAGQADGELQAEAESRHSRMRTMMRASTAAADQTSDSVDNVSQYGAGRWRLQFDGSNGLLESVLDTRTNTTIPLKQEFLYYNSMQDNGQNSGAYIFRPREQHAYPVMNDSSIVTGMGDSFASYTWQQFAPWLKQTIRTYSTHDYITFDWTIGPIPVDDGQGKEVVMRFTTDIANNATWYTDSNGREWQKRVRNHRDTYNWTATEPTAGNYFPVTTSVWMTDDKTSLSLSVDRSEGASSLVDGQLEIMLHRRTLRSDDGNTVEALNETDAIESDGRTRIGRGLIVSGTTTLQLATPDTVAQVTRSTQRDVYAAPLLLFAPLTTSISDYLVSHTARSSFLAQPLPQQLELITLQARPDGRVLFRLAHVYAADEADGLGEPVSVDVTALFVWTMGEVVELSLSANSLAGSHTPLQWKTDETEAEAGSGGGRPGVRDTFDGVTVTIQPMEVRTFAARLTPKQQSG